MNELDIKVLFNGINVEVQLKNGINILYGYSGTGKSLLLQAIDLFCLNNNIKCRLCNYNDINLTPDKLKVVCSDVDVVLLDNADLYLNNDILDSIRSNAQIIVISIKDMTKISTADASIYDVVYDNLSLHIKEY